MKKIYASQGILCFLLISTFYTTSNYAQSFNASGLNGEDLVNPTSLDFGPNGKLYVSQQDGTIFEYSVARDAAVAGQGAYAITETNRIDIVKTETPNHNDDGTINTLNKRQITGLLATGTKAIPVLYVSSSDSRIGGQAGGIDKNLDTNSGVLSRLTWTGNGWDKVDLVRGLPRCEENHSTNGMEIFERSGSTYLLLQQGGNANQGAPSNNFAGTSETYLSAALLIVNLTQLEQMEAANGGPYIDSRQGSTKYIYDLPTLNDPQRADITNTEADFPYSEGHPMYNATIDIGDPFGGNNGLNQAFAEVGGPVQIFSPGFRNAYDVVITADGRIYSGDNGPNKGWGGTPVIYDSNGDRKADQSSASYDPLEGDYVTNEFNNNGVTHGDALHYVGRISDSNGTYYAGHPVPTRAFPSRSGVTVHTFDDSQWTVSADYDFGDLLIGVSGYFNTGFDISEFPDDPIQGEYLAVATSDPRIHIFDIVGASTNGMCEYTASNFDGAMQGDLLTASYNGKINRYQLNASGDALDAKNNNFLTGFGSQPLDIIAQGDTDPFPGTIWAATYGADNITVFEPTDFANCVAPSDPSYVGTDDYDLDGYTNDDEIANGTDICSGGSKPNDYDGDFISDLSDPDDDNDGIIDTQDVFAIDADNGTTTNLPIDYPFWNNNPGTGFYGLGFTGLMLDPNANTDYLDQYDESNLSFGGAGGKATVDAVSEGDASGSNNTQENGFQFGVNVDGNSAPFTVHGKIETPFAGVIPESSMSYGIYIGNGDQDHYLKVAISDGVTENDGVEGFQVLLEDGPTNTSSQEYDIAGILQATSVDIFISVNPSANTAQPYYSLDAGENVVVLGDAITLPTSFLDADDNRGMAVGLISTSAGAGSEYTATWDFLNVTEDSSAELAITENPIDFGTLNTGSGQVQLIPTLTNNGGPSSGSIDITAIAITGTDAALFTNDTGLPLTIGPGADKSLPIDFFPGTDPGTKMANLEIYHTGENSPFIVPLNAVLEDHIEPILAVVARVNAGGAGVTATDNEIDWASNIGDGAIVGTNYSVNTGIVPGFENTFQFENRHASIPDYIDEATFNALFIKERYDATSAPEMEFQFPVTDGNYIVNIYTGNGYGPANSVGARIFDISIENELKGDDIDVVALFGGGGSDFHAGMLSYEVVVSDGELNVLFEHTGVENPVLQAIEIIKKEASFEPITIGSIADQTSAVGDSSTLAVAVNGGNPEENFTYAISGQPLGIDIEPTNGQIFGSIAEEAVLGGPDNNGVHHVTIEVSKPGSVTATTNFTWYINNALWIEKDEAENYTARHECSLVQAGDKFYLMGGRENAKTIDVYQYGTNTWTQISDSSQEAFNHFQATEYKGLIWVIGAFKNNSFPNEQPAEYIWAFDPANEEWIQGPEIPENRRRGSAGLVVYNDKFYIAGGNTIGHNGGYVSWFDEYDPATGTWTPLADAPRPRDHFHSGIIGDKLYVAGGRLSGDAGGTFNPTVPEVDVYDFGSGTWVTLPQEQNIPTPRAAAATVTFNGKLMVIGGEVQDQEVYGEVVSDALKVTEAYDPVTQTWSRLADLNHKRHGTQGIVSGDGVFVLGGSPKLGGGNQKNMEYLGQDNPTGVPSVAGNLTVPDVVDIEPGDTSDFMLNVSGGNVGMFIRSMELTGAGAANYSIVSGELKNALLDAESSHQITVLLSDTGAGTNAVLKIDYGASSSVDIILKNGEISSGIVHPGTQYNAEGDAVSLQIVTNNSGDNLTYTATGLPPTLAIDTATGLISGTVLASGSPDGSPFLEKNGLVVIEAESGGIVPGWTATSGGDANGIIAGNNNFNAQGGGTIPYQITINTPGVYRFNWRSFYSGGSASEENDSWLRFPNDDDVWFFGYQGNPGNEVDIMANLEGEQENIVFPKGSSRITSGPEGTTPNGSGSNGYLKIWRNGGLAEIYDWQAKTSDNDAHNIYVWFVNAGTYTMEISERSAGHAIDKMALYKVDGPSYSDSQLTAAIESDREENMQGASANSPYEVTVTATDDSDPENSGNVGFTWVIDNNGNPLAIAKATVLEGNAPLEVYFRGSDSIDDVAIVDYSWEFGDTLSSVSDLADPSFTFLEAGTYNVLLRVTDGDGNQHTDTLEITVTPPIVHTISATAGENGSISPNGAIEVLEGTDQEFTIVPNIGYAIDDVRINGISVGPMESFLFEEVDGPNTISATFKKIEYRITASSGLGGTISPEGYILVANGENQQFNAIADDGFELDYLLVDGSIVEDVSEFLFENVAANHLIEAVFSEIAVAQYSITATAGQGGSIDPDGSTTFFEGDSQVYNIVPDMGYRIADVTIDGTSEGTISTFTFTAIAASHTIRVSFEQITHTVTATATGNGLISPFGEVEIAEGEDVTFTFMADEGYELSDIAIDGVSVGNKDSYTFSAVTENHSIEAIFAPLASNNAPIALATADINNGPAPLKVTFDASGSVDDNGIAAYAWNFGDGTPDASGMATTHTYTKIGVYTATLTVTDTDGETSVDSVIITVTAIPKEGNEDGKGNDLVLFPNPASIAISLGFKKTVELETIWIFDMSGKLLYQEEAKRLIRDERYMLDISDIPTGFYVVKAKDNKGDEYHKKMLIRR